MAKQNPPLLFHDVQGAIIACIDGKGGAMASLTIRNLDEDLKARLRIEAAQHGHSMEEEVRSILRRALIRQPQKGLGSRIAQRFAGTGGVELELPERKEAPRSADL